jgi:hypothetical protein
MRLPCASLGVHAGDTCGRIEKTVTRRLKELGVLGNDRDARQRDGIEVYENEHYKVTVGSADDESKESDDGDE